MKTTTKSPTRSEKPKKEETKKDFKKNFKKEDRSEKGIGERIERPSKGLSGKTGTRKKFKPFKAPKHDKNFTPDPKDLNTVKALRSKLKQLQDYKRILAEDGLFPDAEDKEMESNIIKQLIRIEKGLSPTKKVTGRDPVAERKKKLKLHAEKKKAKKEESTLKRP
jgi:hypothetical protein